MKLACSLLALLVLVPGCGSFAHKAERTVQETLETSPLSELYLKTFNGAVSVETHDAATVEMEVTYGAYGSSEAEAKANCEELSTDMSADDGKLRLAATKPSGQWMASASYKLTIPRNCSVELNSSNGLIKVKGLVGDAKIETSNGRVEVEEILGNLTVSTSNGRVNAKDVVGAVDVRTSNGKIEYWGDPVGEGNSLKSSNGSITVNVGLSSSVIVSASTSNGGISCVAEKFDEQPGGSKKRKTFAIGSSGKEPAKIEIRTSNGSIGLGDYNVKDLSMPTEPSTEAPSSEVDSSDFVKEEISE